MNGEILIKITGSGIDLDVVTNYCLKSIIKETIFKYNKENNTNVVVSDIQLKLPQVIVRNNKTIPEIIKDKALQLYPDTIIKQDRIRNKHYRTGYIKGAEDMQNLLSSLYNEGLTSEEIF